MRSGIRSAKHWGRLWLESLWITILAAFVLMIFKGLGVESFAEEGAAGLLLGMLSLLPYYLMIAGAFVVLMLGISFFQTYISLAVSMGSTRRAAVLGSLGAIAGEILAVVAASAVIWHCLSDDVSVSGRALLPFLTGLMFLAGAVTVLFGVVIWRWGTAGALVVILLLCAGVGGGIGGALTVVSGEEKVIGLMANIENWFYPVLAVSILLYLCAGAYALLSMKKMEVRL